MSDVCDMAGDRMEQEEEMQLMEIKQRQQRARESATEECVECDKSIPQDRQDATGGTDLCVECGAIQELKTKQGVW